MVSRLALFTWTALFLSAGAAFALPDVEIAFDPAQASPGDQVHFFFSIANDGTEGRLITLETTLQFGDHTIGPFTRHIAIGAGQEHVVEFDFLIPPPAPAGTLTVTIVASDADGSDTDTATLEIIGKRGTGDEKSVLNAFEKQLIKNGLVEETN